MGLMNPEDRERTGNLYVPDANSVVHLKKHYFEKGGTNDGGDWYWLVSDYTWDNAPDDFSPRKYMAGNIDGVKKDMVTLEEGTRLQKNCEANIYINHLAKAIEAASIDHEDSWCISQFDGYDVNMIELTSLKPDGTPRKQKKDGKETQYDQKYTVVSKVLGRSSNKKSGSKKASTATAELTDEIKNIIDTALAMDDEYKKITIMLPYVRTEMLKTDSSFKPSPRLVDAIKAAYPDVK